VNILDKPSKYFCATISAKINVFSCQPSDEFFAYMCGQLELGRQTQQSSVPMQSLRQGSVKGGTREGVRERSVGGDRFLHWQLYFVTLRKSRVSAVRKFLLGHIEPTRSSAILSYVCKVDDTTVDGTFFEWGVKPMSRAGKGGIDWDAIKLAAKSCEIESIPSYAYISFYNSLKSIGRDHLKPIQRSGVVVKVFWGPTSTGKSTRAWEEAGLDAFPKDPMSKFWDGYQGESNIVIDEFRGGINISHILRWFDKYPCNVEIKGSSVALKARSFWITSNLHPREWYKDIDMDTYSALERRLIIEHMFVHVDLINLL